MAEKEVITNIESQLSRISYEMITNDVLIKNEDKDKDKSKFFRILDKLLGVLASNGVYAMWVWAKSQKDIEEEGLFNKLLPLMNLIEEKQQDEDFESYLQRLSEDLHKLLFVKQLLEKTLIYARYHAKALSKD